MLPRQRYANGVSSWCAGTKHTSDALNVTVGIVPPEII